MSRHRWYQVTWPISMRELAIRVGNETFRDGASSGFLIDRVRDDRIEGRFIERLELNDQTTTPFGESFSFERVEFRQLHFCTTSTPPGLEVTGSTTGVSRLINKFAEICDHRLAVSNLQIDVFGWLALFQDLSKYEGYVEILQVGQFSLGGTVSVRAIVKGKEDVRDAVQKLTTGHQFIVEKLQFRPAKAHYGSVVFAHLASAVVRSKDDIEIVGHLRRALEAISDKSIDF